VCFFAANLFCLSLASHLPLRAGLASEFLIRFVIAHEQLLGWIPLQLSAESISNVAEKANRCGAMPCLGWANALLAALDALEPVRFVVVGWVHPLRGVRELRFRAIGQ